MTFQEPSSDTAGVKGETSGLKLDFSLSLSLSDLPMVTIAGSEGKGSKTGSTGSDMMSRPHKGDSGVKTNV